MIFAQFAKIIVLDQVLQYDICTGCKKALQYFRQKDPLIFALVAIIIGVDVSTCW
jgi:hypothetical protein